MTAQAMEKLIFSGETFDIKTEPLLPYLNSLQKKPNLFPASSSCWRGYVGTWELIEDRLYLVDFVGYSANPEKRTYWEIGMDSLFPNQSKVFAEWFTGEIRIPHGKAYSYDFISYEPTYEQDLYLIFNKGYIIGKRTVNNHDKVQKIKEYLEKERKNENQDIIENSFLQRLLSKKKPSH